MDFEKHNFSHLENEPFINPTQYVIASPECSPMRIDYATIKSPHTADTDERDSDCELSLTVWLETKLAHTKLKKTKKNERSKLIKKDSNPEESKISSATAVRNLVKRHSKTAKQPEPFNKKS